MAGNPREHVRDKGFWDGGAPGQSSNGQTAGRPSGYPGRRSSQRTGIKIDIDFPQDDPAQKHEPKK